MGQGLIFEVADHQLDLRMIVVIGVGGGCRDGRVGRERVMAPTRKEFGLLTEQASANDDRSPRPEAELGDLCFAAIGVVGQGNRVGLGGLLDQPPHPGAASDADRGLDPRRSSASGTSWFSNPLSARITIRSW